MKILNKIFGNLKLSWVVIIISSVLIGVYTGFIMTVPALKNTSFEDIGVGFEWWILFAVIIISNSSKPIESALKTFVFFPYQSTACLFGSAKRNGAVFNVLCQLGIAYF